MKKFSGKTKYLILTILILLFITGLSYIYQCYFRTDEQKNISKFKKLYVNLQKVTYNIFFDEYYPRGWAKTNEMLYSAYKKRLKLLKDCGKSNTCFPDKKYKNSNIFFEEKKSDKENLYSVILSDGSALMFGSTDNGACSQEVKDTFPFCGLIFVDINREMPPDEYGKDYFVLIINDNGIYPADCNYDTCKSNITDKIVHPKYFVRVK